MFKDFRFIRNQSFCALICLESIFKEEGSWWREFSCLFLPANFLKSLTVTQIQFCGKYARGYFYFFENSKIKVRELEGTKC